MGNLIPNKYEKFRFMQFSERTAFLEPTNANLTLYLNSCLLKLNVYQQAASRAFWVSAGLVGLPTLNVSLWLPSLRIDRNKIDLVSSF